MGSRRGTYQLRVVEVRCISEGENDNEAGEREDQHSGEDDIGVMRQDTGITGNRRGIMLMNLNPRHEIEH